MGKSLLFVLAIGYFFAQNVHADTTAVTQIIVEGFGEVQARADQVEILVEARGVGATLEIAFLNVREKLLQVQSSLSQIGISNEEVSTHSLRSEENEGGKAFLSSKRDYRAVITILVRTKKLDIIDGILYRLNSLDIEKVLSVEFQLTKLEAFRHSALAQATSSAIAAADSVAAILNVSRGSCVNVNDITNRPDEEYDSRSSRSRFRVVGKRDIINQQMVSGSFGTIVITPPLYYAEARVEAIFLTRTRD